MQVIQDIQVHGIFVSANRGEIHCLFQQMQVSTLSLKEEKYIVSDGKTNNCANVGFTTLKNCIGLGKPGIVKMHAHKKRMAKFSVRSRVIFKCLSMKYSPE